MVKKKVLDEMESIRDFDHVQKYKQTKTVDRQQPREQKRGLKIKKNVTTVVQHICRENTWHLVRHATHVVSRTISGQYTKV